VIDEPGIDRRDLTEAVRVAWGVEVSAFTFVPGLDMTAASYVVSGDGGGWFLKVRIERGGEAAAVALEVSRALVDRGIQNVVAPLRTRAGEVAHAMGGDRSCELYPFVAGRNAMRVGLTAAQWRAFGTTLRTVHDVDLPGPLKSRIPVERFDLPFRASVAAALRSAESSSWSAPSQLRLAELLRNRRGEVDAMLRRAEEIAGRLTTAAFERVLCHGDIHAANIVATDDDGIGLVDWDGPRLAPRERDLLFVIGSRVAREVTPAEEGWFFEGYGVVDVDPEALIYFRYERILEDIGEVGRSVFERGSVSEASRIGEVELAEGQFGPGSMLESAEAVDLSRVPGPSRRTR
jgi:spectinomycin phosphotransferase